jgi:hypothetical protein
MQSKTSRKTKRYSYRSGLERDISSYLKKKNIPFTYEEDRLRYVVPASNHIYTPDFKITTKSGKEMYIEAKGKWDYTDRYKHLLIRQAHPDIDIRFVFSNPRQRIRKGSKTTYADICEGNGRAPFKGVTWKYAKGTIPSSWLNE